MPCNNTNNDSVYNKDNFILVKSTESNEFKGHEEPELHQTDLHDTVNKPKHYMLIPEKGIEVRDLMKVLAGQLDGEYWHGMLVSDYVQMMQYLLRWHRKNGLEDLEKAQWYLSKIIEQVKGTN